MADFQLDTGFALLMLTALSAPVIVVLSLVLWSNRGTPGRAAATALVVLSTALFFYRLTPRLGLGIMGYLVLPPVASLISWRFSPWILAQLRRFLGAVGSIPGRTGIR